MNFNNFYNKTESRLRDSITSLWATGDGTMQRYFDYLFEKKPLIAEPIFQNTFPWEPSEQKMSDLTDIFDPKLIEALDKIKKKDFQFPADRNPYKHQIESWKRLLKEKKSIAVTTGTGSGKTECFMLPVLQDIYENCRNNTGVNAIFLYPLNALIASQQKRIHEWCTALPGINYAVYNGNTSEDAPQSAITESLPQLISRKQVRQSPPQILFTNPTMLEYILIRNKDTELLKNSEGKLRWILLDEAHTLTGSSASEMALLIRRVIDAFKTDIKSIRFAITSATVGDGNDEHLIKFMSDLCGIDSSQISIIKGKRVLNSYDPKSIAALDIDKELVDKLRSDILAKNYLSRSNISKYFHSDPKINTLEWVDELAETGALPVRGHFFSRSIGGVFVCTNPSCNIHGANKPASAPGTFHTVSAKNCDCGWPLLELIACRSCGNFMLEGELKSDSNKARIITQISNVTQAAFDLDAEDDETNRDLDQVGSNRVLIIRNIAGQKLAIDDWESLGFDINGRTNSSSSHFMSHLGAEQNCPFCAENTVNPIHFRISSTFINRILSDILLEETPKDANVTESMLWDGRKYISFTDSRQGTARISALLNIDNEKNWLRAMVYHFLCKETKDHKPATTNSSGGLGTEQLEQLLEFAPNDQLRTQIQIQIDNLRKANSSVGDPSAPRLSWNRLYELLSGKSGLKVLFNNNIGGNYNDEWKNFLQSLFFDQFARRIPRERSLENLGMVNLVYPHFDKAQLPDIAKKLGIDLAEWKDLLKISMDYFVRANFNFHIPQTVWNYSNSFFRRSSLTKEDWPQVNENSIRQNRLVLLICAGLNITEKEELTAEKVDEINDLILELWKVISTNILTNDEGRYRLNFEEKTEFELATKLFLCPVKQRLIDRAFKGYSPWITGRLSADNIRHFKIKKQVDFPIFPFPFNLNSENVVDHNQTLTWIRENSVELRNNGVWNSLHERVIDIKPLFVAGEHSAQQKEARLKQLEEKFESGKLNVLNCSTTMEMGVDIGGISAVLMNNVPPGPANYLQRTGRAGRRSENKSLALTICAPNPVGANAFNTPSWALDHKIAPPMLSFNSPEVVNRHLNAFFLGKFIQSDAVQGINVNEKIEGFFTGSNPLGLQFSNWLLALSKDEYNKEIIQLVKGTTLSGKANAVYIIKARFNFEKLSTKVAERIRNFETSLSKIAESYGATSPEYKAVNYQLTQFIGKNALTYFAEEGFTPSAGIPTGIVDMDLTTVADLGKGGNFRKSNPSFHITRALVDFAPGNQIVLDGWSYTSGGIITKNIYGNQARRDIIQSCKSCGFQRIVENTAENGLNSPCPHCGEENYTGINFKNARSGRFTELIEPVGFAVDIRDSKSRKISESSSFNVVEPLLMNIRPWSTDESSLIDVRESSDNAEILYYNKGKGDGFAVCLNCGRTELSEERLENHKRLRGGKNQNENDICEGNENKYSIRKNVILGGRYQTDFCEVRIREKNGEYSNNESLLYSLGVIFTKTLAEYLAIEEQELSFGVKQYDKYRTVFIFDTARGGAGYSSQFSFHLESILNIALRKLQTCDCQNACTKCLVDRHTSKNLHLLDRNPAIEWIISALDQTIAENLVKEFPDIKKIIGNAKDDINKQIFRNAVSEIWFFVDSKVNFWDPDDANFINRLRNKVNINFVLNEEATYQNQQDKITFVNVNSWSSILLNNTKTKASLQKIAVIKLIDGTTYEYFAEMFDNLFNKNWGTVTQGASFRVKTEELQNFDKAAEPSFGLPTFELFIEEQNIIHSNEISLLVVNELKNKGLDLKKEMSGKNFEVSYFDRYVKSPFSSILLVQFLDSLRQNLNFNIESFTLHFKEFSEFSYKKMFFNNFENSSERNQFIKSYAENNFDIPNVEVLEEKIPHYRFFVFKAPNLKIIIRPDAGVEHGWLAKNAQKFEDIFDVDVIEIKKADLNPILYTISIDK
ncbi:hypothetical protein CO230_03820 [Chryseobacterium sp. 6424]|uniref:DEAD/DEAH box helicase n=1 Tax=Chryseobacterium sp. 6424 TaxID=2039166 RepID=UPI000EFD68CC|nr:DEAD/DEAH box helicase [Chryseobacterium sp. 6424]AYO57326.1 hypothetical protein CO230_03820 [Chryseobacterium sp. 6424]